MAETYQTGPANPGALRGLVRFMVGRISFAAMALGSTVHHFDVRLSDVDRGVYETLSFKVARHPSETAELLVARVLAYCLEYDPDLAWSGGGVSEPDEPTMAIRDPGGRVVRWVEVGAPDAARLHKASKATAELRVYTHRTAQQFLRPLAGERIHRAGEVAAFVLPPSLIAGLAERLDRRTEFDLSVTDGHVFLAVGGVSLEGAVERVALGEGSASS
jgi:uncharacterized protein YaeQ